MELRQNYFVKYKNYFQATSLCITGVLGLWIYCTHISPYLSLTTIKLYKDAFYEYTLIQPIQARLIYSLVYFILASIFLPIAALLNILGGFLFGTLEGVIMVTIITGIAAMVNIWTVRFLFGSFLKKRYTHTFAAFNRAFQKDGISYLFFVRLSGLFPFPIANVLLGLTNVSLYTYFWTTTLGMIPGSILFVYMGKQLATLTSIKDVLSWNILIVFIGSGFLSLLPIFYKKITTMRV